MILSRMFALARKDTSVVLGASVLSNFARIGSTMVLTRILDAQAFGVVAILTSISFTVVMLTDVGIYGYVMRHRDFDDPDFLDAMWTIRLVRHAGITVLMMLGAPLVALLLQKPVGPAIAVYAISFLIDGLGSMATATAPRQRKLVQLSMTELIPQLAAIPVAAGFGLWLRSYWALVIAILFSAAFKAVLSYTLFPGSRRRLRYDRAQARELWTFGRNIAGASFIQLFLMQTDKIALARLLPLATFGLYSISSTLIAAVRGFNSNYTKRILFPAFAVVREADITVQRRTFYQVGRQVRLLYIFAAGALIACAPLAIRALYDARYVGAIPFLRVLAVGNIVSLSALAANEMLIALGRTRHVLYLNIVRLIFLVLAGIAGFLLLGPIGLVMAVAGTDIAAQLYCWWALGKEGIFSAREEALTYGTCAAGFIIGLGVNAVGLMIIR